MLFNSAVFLIFFSVVYPLYLRLNHLNQNRLLLIASYIFYGWWDLRFLVLLFFSSCIDFYCGLNIDKSSDQNRRKFFLYLSLTSNLTILGFFKYYNFFAETLQILFNRFGIILHPHLLHVILPVGISFYTFQAMSYAIDIYRNQLKPTKKLGDFLVIVSFFPHLVAGPIQRAVNLLAQVTSPRLITHEKIMQGTWLFFYGLFQKAFVADNLARMVDPVFIHTPSNGAIVLISIYAYAFQIYGDFAGYSNMARGLAKLMGFELMINFRNPYFSTNPQEFWHRWHISLSTWLRDYLYISLGGNRRNEVRTYINLFLTMFLGGLWHGAAWHYVFWGGYHGLLLIIQRWADKNIFSRVKPQAFWNGQFYDKHLRHWLKPVQIIIFFHLICLGWIFFRSQSMDQSSELIHAVLTAFHWTTAVKHHLIRFVFYALPVIFFEIMEYRKDDPCFVLRWNPIAQGCTYFFIYYCLMIYGIQGGEQFVYFQF